MSAQPDSLIGTTVLVRITEQNGTVWEMPAHVSASRVMYGRHEVYVTPIGGSGRAWKAVGRTVTVPEAATTKQPK